MESFGNRLLQGWGVVFIDLVCKNLWRYGLKEIKPRRMVKLVSSRLVGDFCKRESVC